MLQISPNTTLGEIAANPKLAEQVREAVRRARYDRIIARIVARMDEARITMWDEV